jgi:hypothetical protein
MTASPPSTQPLSLVVEIDRTPEGRLEGRIRTQTADSWSPFSGVLELLKVLEELLDNDSTTGGDGTSARPYIPTSAVRDVASPKGR